jgi:predicted RNase H-like HicB family nuclease
MKFQATIEPDEDGVFVAHCPSLPGCISQGATREEAQANIKEAITGYLKSLKKNGEPIPPLKLDWRGGLRDLQDRYTSMELQHKALEWWED